jgi:hypothetical protein
MLRSLALVLVLAVLGTATAQDAAPAPLLVPGVRLLTNKSVQQELKIDADTDARFKTAIAEVEAQHADARTAVAALWAAVGESRTAWLAATEATQDKLSQDALTAKQRDRLHQLFLQQRGARAFGHVELQKALALTADQVKRLPQALADFETYLDKAARGRGVGPLTEERKAKLATQLDDAHRRGLVALLDDAQKQKYAGLVGTPLAGLRRDEKYVGASGSIQRRQAERQFPLLREAVVRTELALTPEQVAQLDAIPAAAAASQQELRDKLAAAEQARSNQEKAVSKAVRDAEEKVLVPLLSPDQARRYGQIVVQRAGLAAFEAPAVLAALKLTDADKAAVSKLAAAEIAAVAKAVAELQAEARTSEALQAANKKSAELRTQGIAKLVASLPPAAQKLWGDLIGPPFAYVADPRTGS